MTDDAMPTTDPIVAAAVHRFARDGFDASLRSIAADAGVSAALIVKRFGSKVALRTTCDSTVLEWIRIVKYESISAASQQRLLPALVNSEAYAPLVAYVMKSVIAGGPVGRAFIEHMIEDAEHYTADAVQSGLARPSRDESARTRYLVTSALGSFLLTLLLDPPDDSADLPTLYRRLQTEMAGPMLELYTEGLFTTRRMLDDYERYVDGATPTSDGNTASPPEGSHS